jgi:hypothetical protein
VLGKQFQSPALGVDYTEPSEWPADPLRNGKHQNANSVALYGTGRIGEKGRKVQYHLLERDAPWIFSEIQFNSQGAGEFPNWKIYTSIDKTMLPGANDDTSTNIGLHPFNNLSVLKRKPQIENQPFNRIGVLPMEGHLKAFIESAPRGQWDVDAPSPVTN